MIHMKCKFVFLCLIYSFAMSQEKDSSAMDTGMLYGKNHMFFVTAPDGWVLDNQSAVKQGVHAAFYPKGGSWRNSPVVMYASGFGKKDTNQTIQEFISDDSLTFVKRDSSIRIQDAPVLRNDDGEEAIVKWFFYYQYEAVAYFKELKSTNIIVLSARTEEQFKESYLAFKKLVSSYKFITDNVILPKE